MKTKILLLLGGIIGIFITLNSFKSSNSEGNVKIGTQVWTTDNLHVSTFRNGDLIPEYESDSEWAIAGRMHLPACCIYGGDPENGNNYGILYNWYAIHDSRGLAPQGWHIPTEKEWNILVNYLGGNDNAGYKMKSPLGWESNGNGDNSSGFSALPSGCRSQVGTFYLLGGNGYYWSSTKSNSGNALACGLYSNGSYVTLNASNIAYGYACRCIKD